MKSIVANFKRLVAAGILTFALTLAVGSGGQSVYAQEATPATGAATTTQVETTNDDGNDFPWGLLGLLGLAGLMGARPHQHPVSTTDRVPSTSAAR